MSLMSAKNLLKDATDGLDMGQILLALTPIQPVVVNTKAH